MFQPNVDDPSHHEGLNEANECLCILSPHLSDCLLGLYFLLLIYCFVGTFLVLIDSLACTL